MRSRFHPEAREEFLAAIEFYNDSLPGLGLDFTDEVHTAVELCELLPSMWPEIAPGIRRCLLKRFPYVILYSQEADALFIYAVMHMHRDPDCWRYRI